MKDNSSFSSLSLTVPFLRAGLCVQVLFDGSAEILVGVGEDGLINGDVSLVITGFEFAFNMAARADCGGEFQRVGKNSLAGLLLRKGLYFKHCRTVIFGVGRLFFLLLDRTGRRVVGECVYWGTLLFFCFGNIDGGGAVDDCACGNGDNGRRGLFVELGQNLRIDALVVRRCFHQIAKGHEEKIGDIRSGDADKDQDDAPKPSFFIQAEEAYENENCDFDEIRVFRVGFDLAAGIVKEFF